ncbi:MAG: hypothetical protein HQ523_02905 [Lentisphaerae bacterium]|nr:hypothetical protein [Lentisphaerota bacterium]
MKPMAQYFTAAIAMMIAISTAHAGSPQPCEVVYGLVRDAYGFPYAADVEIALHHGAVECDRHRVTGIMPGGSNFRLQLEMDSGGTPYAPYAVQLGDAITVSVTAGGTVQPLVSGGSLSAGPSGATLRLDLVTGRDADGDGLSDAWEEQLIAQSGGRLTTIEEVLPDADFDNDGLTNLEEFHAGTFAFLATDLLQVDQLTAVAGNRLKLSFLTSSQISYRLVATENLQAPSWHPLAFAVDTTGPLQYQEMVGDGSYQTLYIDQDESTRFIRIATQQP